MWCQTHTNWLIPIIENDDKTHNARPKIKIPSSDGGFKKMQWYITITNQTQCKACTNQPTLGIENTNKKNARKAHKQNERFMKYESLIMECPSNM
jgi:hypothetical protein